MLTYMDEAQNMTMHKRIKSQMTFGRMAVKNHKETPSQLSCVRFLPEAQRLPKYGIQAGNHRKS